MRDYLPCVEIEPANPPADAAVIWLHGLGADGHDFESVVPMLNLPASLAVRFVLPHARSIPVTINGGMVMPGWFDILRPGEERAFNVHQLLASATAVHTLIDREVERGIDSQRIVLIGFSQGGSVNFQAGLTYDKPLGGILGLSTFFPTAGVIEVHPANAGVPVQLHHGLNDTLLPLTMAYNSKRYLEGLGLRPTLKTYPMGHAVCPEQIKDIARFIRAILGMMSDE